MGIDHQATHLGLVVGAQLDVLLCTERADQVQPGRSGADIHPGERVRAVPPQSFHDGLDRIHHLSGGQCRHARRPDRPVRIEHVHDLLSPHPLGRVHLNAGAGTGDRCGRRRATGRQGCGEDGGQRRGAARSTSRRRTWQRPSRLRTRAAMTRWTPGWLALRHALRSPARSPMPGRPPRTPTG